MLCYAMHMYVHACVCVCGIGQGLVGMWGVWLGGWLLVVGEVEEYI